MPCLLLTASQHLTTIRKDQYAKKAVAYLLTDRSGEWCIMCQSLPLLASWVNHNLSDGNAWDRVTVTGLFENLNKTSGRSGGYHKGRFRVRSVPLAQAGEEFQKARVGCAHAVVVAGVRERYTCE